jgi:glutathione peroxidase
MKINLKTTLVYINIIVFIGHKSCASHQALRADGSVLKFSDLKGHPVVIVNVASKCGFTHQYAGLQELYDQFKDQGLVVLAFPCNQFGAQEPGSEAEIVEFCSRC